MVNIKFRQILINKFLFSLGCKNSVADHIKRLSCIENMSERDMVEIQRRKLKNLLKFLKSEKGYYQKHLIDVEIDNECNVFNILSSLPILEKKDLSRNDLVYRDKKDLVKLSSSGSSGIRSVCYLSKDEVNLDRALQIIWWKWAGVEFGKPIFQTGNNKRGVFKSIKDYVFNTNYYPAFDLNDQHIRREITQHHSGGALCGYASSLYVISKACEGDASLKGKFTTAVSWGDKLFPHYREKIKDVFGINVYETYGCSEGIKICAQYDSEYMYIMSTNVIVEIVDDSGNALPDGEMGHVLLTSLDRYAMPMVRYRIGDLGIILPKEEYPENLKLNYPLMKKIIGRDTDIVILPNQNKLTVHTFTAIFEYIEQVKQFRVIQNDYNDICIELILNKGFGLNETIDILSPIFEKTLGSESKNFKFVQVNNIPNTPSGKPQLILNRLLKKDKQ
ncbi:phenylacetate--CoA ligase family protein [Vibrio alginolyticus]|uniref:hypothetical protein n=1 Tax=Vibrio alginolyticus TaxID=663 RepID=UPI0021D24CE8